MGRATILDAFNAAAGFAGQGLGIWTAKLKEENELAAQNKWALSNVRLQDKIRDTPYDGDFDKYLGELNNFIEEEYDPAKQENNAPYFREMMDRQRTQSLLAARETAMKKQDEWRFEQGTVSLSKDLEALRNSGWDAEVIKKAVDGRVQQFKDEFGLNPQAEEKLRQGEYEALYAAAVDEALKEIKNVSELQTELDRINAEFREFMPPHKVTRRDAEGNAALDEAGNEITSEQAWGMGEEWEKEVIKQHTARIHNRNMDAILTDDAQYRRLMEEWVRTGSATAKREGDRIAERHTKNNGVIARLMREERDSVTEYADGHKDALLGLFMPYERRESGGGGMSLWQAFSRQVSNWLNSKDPYVEETMHAYFNGKLTVENAKALQAGMRQTLLEQVRTELGLYGGEGGEEQFFRDNIDYFLKMEQTLMNIATKEDTRSMIPQRMVAFKRMIETSLDLPRWMGATTLAAIRPRAKR